MAIPKAPSRTDLDRAIEVFVHGFCFTRSLTHPYLAHRVDGLWVTHDAPRTRKSDSYRVEEWMARGDAGDAEKVDRIVRSHARGRFHICFFRTAQQAKEPICEAFKALGYRFQLTEPIMHHRLRKIPRLEAPATIERVTTVEMADRLAKVARSRQVRHEHLGDGAPMRQYVALDARRRPIGWVRSILVPAARRAGANAGDATWVSNMHVLPRHRRRGIGRALLARMLRDDRAKGSTLSVLTASHTGALLYPVVGYEQVGELLLFIPRKR